MKDTNRKIVVMDGHALNPGDLDWGWMEAYGNVTVYDRTGAEEIPAHAEGAEVIFTNKTPITRELIAACPELKMIGVLATGYNVVDCQAAAERGIPVCNIPAYATDSVVQMTMALLLEICHQVGHHDRLVHEGEWARRGEFCFWDRPMTELTGKTFGIIGCGKIGQKMARVASAFGMKVIYTSRHRRPEEEQGICSFVSMEELLGTSDIVSLHCPLFAENEKMINKDTIAGMKDGAILLNTARGGLVSDEDLAEALNSGKLAGAGLDVVSEEPISDDNPLLQARNCFIAPHIAWAPLETRSRLMGIAEENLRAFAEGHPIHVVNGVC